MIPSSPYLWRIVFIMLGVLFLNVVSITFFAILIDPATFYASILMLYIIYSIITSIFTLTTLGIVFKKAMNGTFGYDETNILIRKSQICEF
jgi:hypothetical protein